MSLSKRGNLTYPGTISHAPVVMDNTANLWHSQCVPGISRSKTACSQTTALLFWPVWWLLEELSQRAWLTSPRKFPELRQLPRESLSETFKGQCIPGKEEQLGTTIDQPQSLGGKAAVWDAWEIGVCKVTPCFWEFRRPCTYAGWAHAQKRPENMLPSGLPSGSAQAGSEGSAVWLCVECMSQHTHIHTVHLQRLGYFFF